MAGPAVTTAVGADNLEIPLIDFSAFLTKDPSTRESTAKAILTGFQTAGFIYIRNHGIDSATVQRAFGQSAEFFKRPLSEKEELAWTTPEANRGYVRQGREKTTDLVDPAEIEAQRALEGADLKESLEIGREGVPGLDNKWPDTSDAAGREFKDVMLSFFDRCKDLHVEVMRAIAVGLGIEETWFDGFCDGGDNTLRLLHYPQVSSKVFKENTNSVRAGAHTDYGSITLLFQDSRGGLQVLSPMGTYVNATPIPDTIVVNAGDLLARWSNDNIKSTKHRVVEPPSCASASTTTEEKEEEEEAAFHPARYSMAYFCNPNFDRFIDAIPGTYDEARKEKKRYQGINSGEYLVQRLTVTY